MKKSTILIIILILAIFIAGGVFAVLYFTTDTFKSNKELFYNQLAKTNIEEFINLEEYNRYYQKQESQIYRSKGTINIEAKSAESKFSNQIGFNGIVDLQNGSKNTKITIKDKTEDLINIDYLKNNDLHGIKLEGIVSQYIVVENKDLKEFINKLGIEENTNIPNKLKQIRLSEITNEQINKELYNKYLNIILEQVAEENYQKIKNEDVLIGENYQTLNGYKVILEDEQYKQVFTEILETAKQDENAYNLLSNISLNLEQISFDEYQNSIDEKINTINQSSGKLIFAIYKQEDETVKIELQNFSEQNTNIFSIENIKEKLVLKNSKIDLENNKKTDIEISKDLLKQGQANWELKYITKENEQEVWNIQGALKRNGQLTSKNIKYVLDVNIQNQENVLNIKMDENIKFDENQSIIEVFEDDDYAVINEINSDQLNILINNLKERISPVLNLEKGTVKVIENIIFEAYNLKKTSEGGIENLNGMEKMAFNAKFQVYEGTQDYNNTKVLMDKIIQNNQENFQHIIEQNSISLIEGKTYNIEFEKDEQGYIYKAIITEQ